jgi:hypothetical protein
MKVVEPRIDFKKKEISSLGKCFLQVLRLQVNLTDLNVLHFASKDGPSNRMQPWQNRETPEGEAKLVNDWCERGDSNPHGFTRQILSLVRLPIPPLSRKRNYRVFFAGGHAAC